MMVMTAKVDKRKITLILVAVMALMLSVLLLLQDSSQSTPTAVNISSNDARVQFLEDFGWEVVTSPTESSRVTVPEASSQVFDRYNALQKSQGYDLSSYAGKQVMRYVYEIKNYPGATESVYATLLVYKNRVIGGDITDTGAKGKIRSFQMPDTAGTPAPESTQESNPNVPG